MLLRLLYYYSTYRILTVDLYSPEWGYIACNALAEMVLSVLRHIEISDRCTDNNFHFLTSPKLLINVGQKYYQSVATNQPAIARFVAGCAFYRLLADLCIERTNRTVFSIFLCFFTLQVQRALESRGQHILNIRI